MSFVFVTLIIAVCVLVSGIIVYATRWFQGHSPTGGVEQWRIGCPCGKAWMEEGEFRITETNLIFDSAEGPLVVSERVER